MKWILLLTLLASPLVQADITFSEMNSYRCGNKLIQKGMTKPEIMTACPRLKPVDKKQWTRTYSTFFNSYHRHYEGWVYQQYGKFDVWVVFYQGRVIEILQTNQRS
ncbi:DUF2845 domain-containing protein [Methylophaga sp. OBS3]|uniref:DUF2845 domain-containing protein n=1 Tax=Methylophaga sp. OBS3 TaxID=2991934 RepID=UPI002252B2B3|nr:DUF2845 domain-containing protein [Methylophaga sp. OBS3]MCX4189307.1 DUF2845 domain-containing protein [Methylophaga sp. OBS3]